MKKFLVFVAAALLCACSTDREHLLKVYNWSEYIEPDVISEFETWYEEQTGENVRVIYQTFDVNETMLSKIEKGHEDFDVVCPSDYIIERMLQNDMLLPILKDFGDTPNYIEQYLSPFARACFDKIEGGDKNANDYAVGYMWGTTGLIYNAKYVTDEEASTWDALRNPKFDGKIFMKESARDVFSQIIIYLRQKELEEGTVTLDELMHDSSDKSLADVEAFLADVKPLVAGWEADFGKDQMVQERGWISLNWSGDGLWTAEQAAPNGIELRYSTPKEGFTLWFDGWVIPKYARNPKAASYWINFMSRPDVAIRNTEETGYVTTCAAPEMLEAYIEEEFDPIDISYFFPGVDSARVNPVRYPDKSAIERSAIEHDWGDRTPALMEMWNRVKGDNATGMTVFVVAAFIVALAAFAVWSKLFKGRKRGNRKRR
ncbi:MAG: ABC transporter substrate-binding protein [Bacteroidales bacterium]|nr:ABC transporter substrate-binding protein [Bacteroidales bacterium]